VSIIGYTRVSTSEQGQSGLGLDAQRAAILAARPDATIIEEVASGGRAENRPVLEQARSVLRRGDTLVVSRLDRLTRSVGDFATLLDEAKRRGFEVLVLDPPLDTTTPFGEAMANMCATFAQLERRLIGQRVSEALRTQPNYAYSEVRARARQLRDEGLPLHRIAQVLEEEGVKPIRGKRLWPNTINQILR
jgi:DNA invertase Pin-like site-specific DNA recombinase